MMVDDVEHRPHCHKGVDEGQSDPDNEREILLPERLAGFLPVTATPEQCAKAKVEDTDHKGRKRY
jgi:hypothetical protein